MTDEEKTAWRAEQAATREKHRLERQAVKEKNRLEWQAFSMEERQFRAEENKRKRVAARDGWVDKS